jgi:hypothetical protein
MMTLGPRPTAAPEGPSEEESGEESGSDNWWQWIEDLLNGNKGQN